MNKPLLNTIAEIQKGLKRIDPGAFILGNRINVALQHEYYISDHVITLQGRHTISETDFNGDGDLPMVNVSW